MPHDAVSTAARFVAGSGVPLVTPLRDGALDLDAFAELIEWQIDAQTDALIVCGSTGENAALSLAERAALIECATRVARGRVAVIAATGCETLDETLVLTASATNAGADGVLVITPRAIAATQDGLFAYLGAVASHTDLPFYLYNYPARTGVEIGAATVERLVAAHPHIVGLKQTDGNLRLITEVRSRLGGAFHLFAGIEQLALPGLVLGTHGMITACANIVPRETRALFGAFGEGRLDEARRIHGRLSPLFDAVVYAEASPAAALKYLLLRRGLLRTNEHRLPTLPPTADAQRHLDAVLAAATHTLAAAS